MKILSKVAAVLLGSFFGFGAFAQPMPPGPPPGGCTNCPPDTNVYNFVPPHYVPGLKLFIPPSSGTNLFLNLLEADPAGKYDIYFASNLVSAPWDDIFQGTTGQTNFTLSFPFGDMGFFRAARTDTPVTSTADMTVCFVNSLTDASLVQATVTDGPAAAMAVLVNDTNFADAVWIPFSAIPYVLLGTNDGTYQVTFGFIGSDGQTNWISASITLDTTPPALVITNLAIRSGSRPFIDPAGFATKSLSAVNYVVVDANGVTNSGQGLVVAQTLNPADISRSTNWIECVDLALALGTNRISLQVTDWAGNMTATNFSYVFDTNGDTTAPVITLIWPQNGTQISGDRFTVQGKLDDDTATVVLQYTDTNGTVQTVSGLVERGGNIWVENVPLTVGTNQISIMATDAAGNVNTTNISVLQSSLVLTVTPLSDGQMQSAYATVQGTVSDPNCGIAVNGIQGANNGDGTWEVDNVPLPSSGTVTLQATAQPNDDTAVQTLLVTNSGPVIFTQSYFYDLQYNDWFGTATTTSRTDVAHINLQWARGSGGTRTLNLLHTDFIPYFSSTDAATGSWPADNGYIPTLSGYLGNPSIIVPPPPVEWMEQSAISGTWVVNSGGINSGVIYSESSQREVRLFTGGKALRQRQGLFNLSAGLNSEGALNPDLPNWWTYFQRGAGPFLGAVAAVPSPQISLGALGNLKNDGNLWTLLPDGIEIVITPKAPMTSYYGALPSQQKYKLHILVNSAAPLQPDHVVRSAHFCVGQYLTFTPFWSPSLPDGTQKNPIQWAFDGTFVNNATNLEDDYPVSSDNYYKDASLLNNETTAAWWVSGGFSSPVTYTATVGEGLTFPNGQYIATAANGEFNMFRPNISNFQTYAPYYAALVPTNSPNELQLGGDNGAGNAGAMAYNVNVNSVAPFSGVANIVQLVNASRAVANTTYGGGQQQTTGGQYWLDNSYPYNSSGSLIFSPLYYNVIQFLDQPGYGLNYIFGAYPANLCSINDSFKDYVVFKPDGNDNNIYVTLGRVFWSWSASTSKNNGVWSNPTYQVNGPSSPDDSDEFPTWPDTLYNSVTGTGN